MLFIKFLLSVREHYTFLIKQKKSYFPVLLFTTIWINSNKSPFPLTKMKLHLQNQLCEKPMSKLMQVMSRSMRFWFTINAKAKSRRYFLKKKKASQYDVRVCCSTSEVSKRLVISRPRTVFKNCCAPETILHFLRYCHVSVADITRGIFSFQCFIQWSTWCMAIPKGTEQKTNRHH